MGDNAVCVNAMGDNARAQCDGVITSKHCAGSDFIGCGVIDWVAAGKGRVGAGGQAVD